MAMNIMSGRRTLPRPNIVKPKSVDGILMEATVRNIRVDGIKVKVYRRMLRLNRLYVKCLHRFHLIVLWSWT